MREVHDREPGEGGTPVTPAQGCSEAVSPKSTRGGLGHRFRGGLPESPNLGPCPGTELRLRTSKEEQLGLGVTEGKLTQSGCQLRATWS